MTTKFGKAETRGRPRKYNDADSLAVVRVNAGLHNLMRQSVQVLPLPEDFCKKFFDLMLMYYLNHVSKFVKDLESNAPVLTVDADLIRKFYTILLTETVIKDADDGKPGFVIHFPHYEKAIDEGTEFLKGSN